MESDVVTCKSCEGKGFIFTPACVYCWVGMEHIHNLDGSPVDILYEKEQCQECWGCGLTIEKVIFG